MAVSSGLRWSIMEESNQPELKHELYWTNSRHLHARLDVTIVWFQCSAQGKHRITSRLFCYLSDSRHHAVRMRIFSIWTDNTRFCCIVNTSRPNLMEILVSQTASRTVLRIIQGSWYDKCGWVEDVQTKLAIRLCSTWCSVLEYYSDCCQ